MRNRAVFLDRDNTLILDKGYTHKIADLLWIPNVIKSLKSFSKSGFKIIVITNQSGVARGYYNEEDINIFHKNMNEDLFEKAGIKIDKFYYCPHLSNANIKKYSIEEISNIIIELRNIDVLSKSSSIDSKLLFHPFIIKTCKGYYGSK